MNRFFIPPNSILDENFVLRNPATVFQIRKVLRAKVGEKIILLDNSGFEFPAEILKISRQEISLKILEKRENLAEPNLKINLFQALPNSTTKFEEILQHATEVGVSGFWPIICERSETRKLRNPERLAKILTEAAEQSERGKIPTLAEPVKFGKIWDEPPAGLNLIADSFSTEPLLAKFFSEIQEVATTNIFVGPEGGFSEKEIMTARKFRAQTFSLGRRILRTETAGVAIASAIFFG
ncbi:16S rRNA (uracil(1498)-N(3))-methyltransferase [Candidatus Gracilibacteria bacterium]|nr:16S rRNA (uracil(1498)-N(3))-methyltransferase [Candidatus Gracilibacteria bacterium]MCF7856014.1 16S rRNA (uracil(1498)-N(3))-methyltransferase [Candidatus Gracilibacteria bacterium]MCF7896431.1 16S rRNA (uracil(1498)-N(3))-methyltransferase [Candidatus Gracilibacteria bacterium]